MNLESVYAVLADAVESLEIDGITSDGFVFPNAPPPAHPSGIWCEFVVVVEDTVQYTEISDKSKAVAVVTVCVSENDGTWRANSAANDVATLFSNRNAQAIKGFSETRRIANSWEKTDVSLYFSNAAQTPGGFENGVYKTAVRIDLEIIEERAQ